MKVSLALVIATALGGWFLALPTHAEQAVPGHAVLAKPTGAALVIWDATSVIASIVKDKIKNDAANAQLEHDALAVLAKVSRDLDKSAKTVTVRIVYRKIGAVSPVYNTPTFLGTERYATLTAAAGDVRSDRGHWKELDAKVAVPPWLAYRVIGRLPPR